MKKLIVSAVVALCCAASFAQTSQPVRPAPMTQQGVEDLLSRMTLREKIGQLNFCRITNAGIEEQVARGEVGGLLNVRNHPLREKLERLAVERSRLGIPLLTGSDVIHGYRTIFPIPLGQAASWNPALCEEAARVAALEAASMGTRWTFAPMVDIARDPRWGRMAEGCGEDPFLTGTLGAAMVRGFQGADLSDCRRIAACPKHFAGYGASEGGRDYNTVDVSDHTLREIYLAPFKDCVRAGAATVMAAFSDVNGTPASANAFLLRQVLRDEWKFDGFVVSDAKAIEQLIKHGLCPDAADAARQAMLGGMDVEIISTCYLDHLEDLVNKGSVPPSLVDDAARRVLRLKWKLGLFDRPYAHPNPQEVLLMPAHLAAAREAARQSLVLLKNDKQALPLRKGIKSIAVVGPLADSGKDLLGCWAVYGKPEDSRAPLSAIRELAGDKIAVNYAAGLPDPTSGETGGFAAAVAAAKASEVAVLFVGEPASYSGEAHNRAFLTLPGAQLDLIKAIQATGTPTIVVLMSGRPLELGPVLENASAILMAWHPGTMGGPAIADALFGDYNPAGKLPISWPRTVGQVPIHYNHMNTGRPAPDATQLAGNDVRKLDTSHVTGYLDLPLAPQFPFGFGLSYTTFQYSDLRLESPKIKLGQPLRVRVKVANTGDRAGDEVAQLYVRDLVASVPQPVRQLKGFERVHLAPGEGKTVEFVLTSESLAIYNRQMKLVTEPGRFQLWVGGDSDARLADTFEIEE